VEVDPIGNTLGVLRLLTRQSSASEYHEPCVIADDFVEQLRRCSFKNGEDNRCLRPGSRIRVLHGPFAGRDGVITSMSGHDRMRLLLHLYE
jgi:hypothetical protein